MFRIFLLFAIFFMSLVSGGCGKKHHAARTDTSAKNSDSLTKKVVIKPRPKEVPPKVISVNDSVARKSVDGRLYYDLMGHRYWKNYKDGKYYLFNKSMYTNDAFKKPG